MDPSKLAERLRGIVGGAAPRREPVAAAATPAPAAASAEAALGGSWSPRPSGACFVVERRFEPDSLHGRNEVGTLAATIAEALPSAGLLTGRPDAAPPLLFFDLETTGLSGGAGTYAFLIGCGWFDDDGAFTTRQYMLTRLADERTMLVGFTEELGRAGALVSFNGKTFDAPVLETRYSYHRLQWSGGDLPHLDMLHPARRFWGAPRSVDAPLSERVARGVHHSAFLGVTVSASNGQPRDQASSCSLGSLERRILGASRVGDVPGFEIPERYFQFLRSGDARPLAGVLEHNRLDLLSLAGVTARLLSLVHRDGAGVEHATEALALGRLYWQARLEDRAEAAFRRALSIADAGWLRAEALRALARAARRRRKYDEAAELWREVLHVPACPPEAAREAHEALAIYHEHRLRDLEQARSFALRILDEPAGSAWADAVRHRLARIERKMGLF